MQVNIPIPWILWVVQLSRNLLCDLDQLENTPTSFPAKIKRDRAPKRKVLILFQPSSFTCSM